MRYCLWLFLLIQQAFVCAQNGPYNFSKLTTNNGLSHNQINSILKDTDGFLWFGTTSGLNRYDGYSFKIYRKNPNDSASLSDNSVGTKKGKSCYRDMTPEILRAFEKTCHLRHFNF